MSRHTSASHFHKSKTLNDKYLLGDEIGKGAYGRVYKSLDLENGDFVAIKQVSLENIPAEDLASIMQEIDLLKNLNHKNIVKYQGSLKTKTHLYIILEYVENGSLASIIKPNKFGAFPESLVAVYIAQVLEGLAYLHEQGVIHRDIKGANILTTKEGLVKLADFGVATKLTEADVNTHSVVGTPYWMAPEVIEMSGVTPASDIWSVGCTVIELLTCVPPYYDLQPMPALFRIVQDDHPPLPEHLSGGMIDFLHQCFRKDAKLRPDAKVLLKHPWIRNSRRALQNTFRRTVGRMSIPQDVSTVVERTIEDGQKENQMPPAQEESTLKDPVTSGNDENDIKGQITASPTKASGELNVDVHAACGGAARLSPDEVSEKFDAYISASKESEQLNAFKHQPVEACTPDSKTLSSSVKGFKSDLDVSESANGSQKGATNLDSNASRIEQQVISAANSQGTGSLLPQRAETISSCDKQEQVEICAAVWITNKISQRDHKVCTESNDYQPTLEVEKSTPPNYELRFSDTPTNGMLHELFEESFSRVDQSTIEGNTSAIIPKTHMTDKISASKSKLNGLAVDIKPKMAQKMVEDEVSLEKQNGENLFTALIDAVEDDELESNGLVFESNAEGRDCYANQVEKSMPPNYELRSNDTPADGILHELFEESFSRVDRSTIEGNTSAIITKPHMTDKISPAKSKLNGLAVDIKPKMAQKMVEGEVSLQKQNGENLFNALINAVEDDELESNGLVFESNAEGRDCYANQAIEVTRLINLLKPEEPEERIITVCQKLISMFHESPDQKSHLANQHGVMPLLEMLEVHNNRIVYAILQLINEIVKDNTKIQQNACLVGMIPAIMHFAAPECTREIRMQAAHFIQQMCKTSVQTLQMFVACRGLPVLVSFLEPDYAKYREMVHIAIDCMWQVFELQSSTPKNDFCRIFAKSGVLVRLVNTIYSLNEATRLDSITGVGPEKAYLQSRSGPLEHLRALFGQFESVKPCSGQLDSARLHSGQTEIPRQTVQVLGSPKAWLGPEINPSASQLEQMTQILAEKYSRPISGPLEASNVKISVDYSLEKVTPQEKLQLGGTVENAHSFLVQAEHTRMVASAREQLQQLHADFAQLTPQTDRELSKECFTISEVVQQSTDQASLQDHSSTSNEPTDTCCEQVPKLLALAEKEHFSKPFPSYLDHSPHYPASTEKTETSLPLLHHSSAIRKANGELEILLAAFAEKNDIGALELIHNNSSKNCTRFEMANASKLFPNASPQKYGAIHSSEGASSDSGLVSQSASGLLSGAGMLNARPGSAASSGLLSQTVSALNKDVAKEYLAKVGDLLFEFSRADTFVKSHMCTLSILIKLFTMLNKLEQPFLVKILKCIKELSMDPCTLELLQRADAPKHLIPLLQSQEGPYVSQIHSQVLNALYNLCKINKRRQEQAAECGIITHLMHFITTNSPLKQIALPLLCDMAHASRYTREQLRVHKGLELYLGLLDDEYWAFTALDSLAVCLAHDNEHRKIEQALLKNGAVQKLVAFFQSCNGPSFVHILEPFLKIINKSIQLNTALAISGLTPLLVGRLQHQDAIARLSLLKLIKAVYEHHPRPKQLIVEHDLPSKLQKLIEERRDGEHSGGQVLVKQMATALLKALHINTIL